MKDKNILLKEGNVLIDRINTLKNKSKKRIEKSKAILKEYDVVNVNINVIIEKSKVIRDNDACDFNILIETTHTLNKRANAVLEKYNIPIEGVKLYCDIVTIHKNVIEKHKEESKAFLKEYAVNKDNASMLIERLRKMTRKASDNIKKVIDEPKKGLEDIKEVLHTHMKNRKDLSDNKKILYESKKACRKTLYDIKTAWTKRLQDIEKISMYTNIEKTFDDIQKELELIKNESYYIKKNIQSHKKEIGKIKNNPFIEKLF